VAECPTNSALTVLFFPRTGATCAHDRFSSNAVRIFRDDDDDDDDDPGMELSWVVPAGLLDGTYYFKASPRLNPALFGLSPPFEVGGEGRRGRGRRRMFGQANRV
jgi:hypothetical protein